MNWPPQSWDNAQRRPGVAPTTPAMVNTCIRGADMAESTCTVIGCERPHRARGMCSTHWRQSRPPLSAEVVAERFWSKVDRSSGDGACWPWTRNLTTTGYGWFWNPGGSSHAHRVAYELSLGPIPDTLTLDHLCRNRVCVNPAHLEPVTLAENILRSESPAAINARKTLCIRGHEMRTISNGARRCYECPAERARRYRRERAA